jgi:hypothetical protein
MEISDSAELDPLQKMMLYIMENTNVESRLTSRRGLRDSFYVPHEGDIDPFTRRGKEFRRYKGTGVFHTQEFIDFAETLRHLEEISVNDPDPRKRELANVMVMNVFTNPDCIDFIAKEVGPLIKPQEDYSMLNPLGHPIFSERERYNAEF